jgi:hypothetical protein
MGKGRNKRKRAPSVEVIAPTPEQLGGGEFHRGNHGHYRRVPVIDTMLKRDQITPQEHLMLSYYRDQASLAEKSEVKSCLDFSVKGGDMGPPAAITSALLETARIERDLGSLRQIARAVVVEDKSIAQWCIEQFGGRERYGKDGRFVAIVPVNESKAVQMATMELRMAARRIVR